MINFLYILINRDVKTIGKHINNALKEEVDMSTVAKFVTVQLEGDREVKRNIKHYNLELFEMMSGIIRAIKKNLRRYQYER